MCMLSLFFPFTFISYISAPLHQQPLQPVGNMSFSWDFTIFAFPPVVSRRPYITPLIGVKYPQLRLFFQPFTGTSCHSICNELGSKRPPYSPRIMQTLKRRSPRRFLSDLEVRDLEKNAPMVPWSTNGPKTSEQLRDFFKSWSWWGDTDFLCLVETPKYGENHQLGGGFKYFLFSPLFREMIHFH